MLSLGIVLLFAATVAGETAYLESLNSNSYSRGLSSGQSETLNFRLRHSRGVVDLNFEENVGLNTNAPIFLSRRTEDGDSMVVPVAVPDNQMQFFQDKRNGAYVRSTCHAGHDGPCYGSLEGNILIDGKEYKLEPVTQGSDKRTASLGVPHRLEELERIQIRSAAVHVQHNGSETLLNDYVYSEDDYPNESLDEIEDLTEEEINEIERLLVRLGASKSKVRTRQSTGIVNHGIELVLAIDHLVFATFAAANQGLPLESIYRKVREYYCHVVNGVDLRYATINETDISFYVTFAGFVISETEANSPWLTYTAFPDGLAGLQFLRDWRLEDDRIPRNDHVALITGSDIQYSGSTGTAGLAYLNALCQYSAVSVNEEFGYFQGAGVLAHELGHNLGSPHDSGASGEPCDSGARFIMQPFVPSLGSSSSTINPWRFSPCSIESFREYVNALGDSSCTLDQAAIYNVTEFEQFNSSLVGAYYTNDEMCRILLSDGTASNCGDNINTSDICRNFQCQRSGSTCSSRFVAAHGTACGDGKQCFEGLCQLESPATTAAPTNPPATTAAPTNPPTTTAPTTTTTTTTAAPTNPPTTTAAPTNPPSTSAAPTNPPTTPRPSDSTSARVTTQTASPSTDRPDLECRNTRVHGYTCNELRIFFGNKFRMCKRFSNECCAMCRTSCNKDRDVRGRETYTCQQLIDEFGFEDTCRLFAFDCCYTCHKQ